MINVRRLILLSILGLAVVFSGFPGGGAERTQEPREAARVADETTFQARVFASPSNYTAETGQSITSFAQAPMLDALDLPPVRDRLPVEPLVIQPHETIGNYGGNLRGLAIFPDAGGWDIDKPNQVNLFRLEHDLSTFYPSAARDWEFNDDLTSITISLREGMRWSDGVEVTTEDVRFAYEDIWLNTEINPTPPALYSPGGQFMELEIIDDYTFRLHFAVPFPPILNALALSWQPVLLYPSHYLADFHIDYNSNAEADAAAAGFSSWVSWFGWAQPVTNLQNDINRPTLGPWVLDRIDNAGNRYFVRNPYFWAVDTAGNQLPYIDTTERVLVENREVRTLRIIGGNADLAAWDMPMAEFTLFRENEQAGGYRAMIWPQAVMGRTTFEFNYTTEDPFKNELYNDLRFRQAMSVAIDRDEINEVMAFGEGRPYQATVAPNASFYQEWMGQHYAQYDPDLANELLDEIGLSWDSNRRWRLDPNGRPIQLTVESQFQIFIDYSMLVKDYWEAVGIQVTPRLVERSLLLERRAANQMDVGVYFMGASLEPQMFQNPNPFDVPTQWASFYAGNQWSLWLQTDGAEGIEPPEDVKRGAELAAQWQQTEPGTPEYLRLGEELVTNFTENLRAIGVMALEPIPIMIRNGLGNTPTDGTWNGGPLQIAPYLVEQWYWQE